MAYRWRFWRRKPALVKQLIVEHMGGPCDDAETVSHTIRPIERVNLQLVLDRWVAGGGKLVGYSRESFFSNTGISQLLLDDIVQAPVQRQRISSSPDDELDCVLRGLYLLRHAGQPIVILLSHPDSRFEPPVIELLARQRSV